MSEQRPDRPPRKNGRNSLNGGLRFSRSLFGWFVCIGLAAMVFMFFQNTHNQYKDIPLSQFEAALSGKQISWMDIQGDDIEGKFTHRLPIYNSSTNTTIQTDYFRTTVPTGTFQNPGYLLWIMANRGPAEVDVENNQSIIINVLLPVVPWLLLFGVIYFFLFRQLRNSGGAGGMLGNFGRSKHRITSKEHTNVTFEDVAGVEEAKEEVMEIVEFLKNPRKFQRLGGRIPRGVLLVGEPGTGKTLLAKAIAGEADCPFFSISGSDFVEMFVGVGASRVRDLFKQAKDNSPCIIFLDEIDAVGRRRGSGFSSGGHDEREQTLNAILVEMDGFDTNDQVIVCAATNRVDVLDPALTRPGRFDRQIYVPLPDIKGRLEILKVHSRKVKLGPTVDLMKLARATPGFSGADLAAIINESALGATLANKDYIENDDLEEARDKVRFGRANKSRAMDEKEKIATAYHEAGHAVVQYLLRPDSDPIHKVTIIPRGRALGATMTLPEKDRYNYSRKWCLAFIKMSFGGRIAEEMFTGDTNSGVLGDIRQATATARRMIAEWGMNERLGFVYYGEEEKNSYFDLGPTRSYSEETARAIDEETRKLIDDLYAQTRTLLEAQRDRIEAIAKALMRYETLDSSEIDRIMRGDNLTKPTVGDLLEREQGRRAPVAQPRPDGPDVRLGGGPLPAPG
jgi:cell division protease FtsH